MKKALFSLGVVVLSPKVKLTSRQLNICLSLHIQGKFGGLGNFHDIEVSEGETPQLWEQEKLIDALTFPLR